MGLFTLLMKEEEGEVEADRRSSFLLHSKSRFALAPNRVFINFLIPLKITEAMMSHEAVCLLLAYL